MFRWIFSVVGLFTATWSYGVTLCGVWIMLLYYSTKKQYKTLLRFLTGAILACFSLWYTHFIYEWLQKVSLDGSREWVVLNQRSATTRVIQTNEHQILLQSKKHIVPWQTILFSTEFTRALLPTANWRTITPSWFFSSWFVFEHWLAMKGFLWRWSVKANQLIIREWPPVRFSPFDRFHFLFKEWVESTIKNNQTRALLIWMTIWDRSLFSSQEYDNFVQSWLVHILAVSGSNVVYLSFFLSVVFFWLPFYARSLLIWISIVLYGLLCGADSSVVRAIAMWVLGLIATWSWRTVQIWTLLQITAWAMLLWNPLLLWFDLWFLLSFSAVIGIVVVGNRYTVFLPQWRYSLLLKTIWWLFVPLFGATVWVNIVLIPLNGYFSITWLLVNSIVNPLIPLFLILWVLYIISPVIPLEWLLDMLSESFFVLSEYITTSWYVVSFSTPLVRWIFAGLLICFLIRIHYCVITQERSVSG